MDDILRDFVVETSENIELVDSELVRFEQDPNNGAILAQIFRLVHTVKGTCGFLNLPRLEALAHAAETVIGRFRDGNPVTQEAVTLILLTIDRIKLIISELDATAAEPSGDDQDLIEALRDMETDTAPEPTAAEPDFEVGSLIYQLLERPLKPDEVSLDELEKVFRDTPGPDNVAFPSLLPGAPPEAGPPPAAPAADPRRNTIRVPVDTLEHLMTMVSELVLTRNQLLEISRRGQTPEYNVPLQRLSQVTGELQDGVMKTRMQPVGSVWATLPRLVRDLCKDLGKEIDLETEGADTEIDRQLLELVKDPITHMIRNAADHGIERPEERLAAGKPRRGTIRVRAMQEGGYIGLQISDDGKGLNIEGIRAKAVKLGLATEAESRRLSEQQLGRFIFHPGFSTAEKVTSVSGRGVGMDVVRNNIELAGGTSDVRSDRGRGTTVNLKIPLTLAIASALIVTCQDQRFAIPQLAIVEIVRTRTGSETKVERLNNANVLRLRDKLLPVIGLDQVLGLESGQGSFDERFIVICQHADQRFGLAVDAVLQTEEIVVKPVSTRLRDISAYSGTTILGDGAVIMILDCNGIGADLRMGARIERQMQAENEAKAEFVGSRTSLLMFKAGPDGIKAVPLGLVTRLEEIDIEKIERADGRLFVQYRGRLMPLVPANASVSLRAEGSQPVLVFSRGRERAGLMVDEIVDIVEDDLRIDQSGSSAGCLGSAIVRGRATDIVDVTSVLPFVGESASGDVDREQRPSLLLVDDNDFFRALLAPVLQATGFRVHAASGAEEALSFLETHPCEVLVTDLDMPGVTGFDLVNRLRGDKQYDPLRIIGLSARGGPGTVLKGRELGFSDIVGKLDRQGLLQSLRDLHAEEARAA